MKNEKEINGIAFELCKKMIHLQDEVDDGKNNSVSSLQKEARKSPFNKAKTMT